MIRTANVKRAAYSPILPMVSAMYSSFPCNGVNSSSICSISSAYPDLVLEPTAQTIALPYPETIREDPMRKGFGLLW